MASLYREMIARMIANNYLVSRTWTHSTPEKDYEGFYFNKTIPGAQFDYVQAVIVLDDHKTLLTVIEYCHEEGEYVYNHEYEEVEVTSCEKLKNYMLEHDSSFF